MRTPARPRAGPGQQRGQVGRRGGVRRGGPHHGQVGGHPLVEVEDLVGLRPVQAAPAHQLVQPLPLLPVRGDERVQIHGLTRRRTGARRRRPSRRSPAVGSRAMSSSTVGVGVDDLVTGEAVALELPAARRRRPCRLRARRRARHAACCSGRPSIVAVLATADSDEALVRRPCCSRRARAGRAAHDAGDADPRPVAGQAGPGPAHGARRRAAPSASGTPSPRALVGRRGDLAAVRRSPRWSAPWSAPRASAWATTRPAPTSCGNGCAITIPAPADDATGAGRVGGARRHRPAARRPRDGGAPVPRAGRGSQPRLPGIDRPPSCRPRCCATSPRPRRPAATPRWC